MMLKKLPIGIQTFSKIQEGNYLYVDKTGMSVDLIENGEYYFLSRPRRFGKSLFISTLQALFEGRQELFTGLAAETRWDWLVKYPVIKISFAGVARTVADMKQDVSNILQDNQERLGIDCPDTTDMGGCLRLLIKNAAEKYRQKVVILVDEYDKLILDNLDQIEMAREAREILKDLYTTIKDSDEFIKFAFLTGVSRFGKVSVFSGLNNLKDITLDKRYATICGYTQADLNTTLKAHLQQADKDRVREWYNGYNFNGEPVYNPFDILLFIDNDFIFNNYWFATGTPTFLIKLIRKHNYYLPKLADLWVNNSLIDSFQLEDIRLEPILFQAGYLTIRQVRERERGGLEYLLCMPNKEVQLAFNDMVIDYLTDQITSKNRYQDQLYAQLKNGDLNALEKTLTALFASIPYNNYVNNTISSYEGYFASVIYAYLASLGLDITAEDVTSKGRIDLTVKLKDKTYILEFKVDQPGSAMNQLMEKNYQEKYLAENNSIYLIGIDFSSIEKNITTFAWKRMTVKF
ncbi:ATP-binding protein [Desulfobacter vibrioformis]|uniref:ATP-binding protein n=1 Tax=Desulfobacter vibrioformis TaxID=34031 RepID=UPI001B805DF7|nr:ATP-binding protein [Desulfobacter vibrioformis]